MPYIAYVDPIDACHLKCPTCIRGARGMKNTSAKMSLDHFRHIIAKARAEKYERIGLFSWSEPFLNLSLHDYVEVVKQAGLRCDISTTLSLRRVANLEKVLCAGLDDMIVSMSGADQETYQRNHVGGSLAYALDNLERAREIISRHGLATNIRMRFLRFHYNADSEPALRSKAAEFGFNFETIEAGGDPDAGPQQVLYQTSQFFVDQIAAGSKLPEPDGSTVCPLIFDQLAVDQAGDVHLCCAFPNVEELKLGSYLDLSEDDLLVKRFRNPFCRTCTIPRRATDQNDAARLAAALEAEKSIAVPA